MKSVFTGFLICSVLLAGCGSRNYCLREQRYEKAESIPPIEGGDGLVVPQSPTALVVPPPPAKDVPYGVKVQDDSKKSDRGTHVECLDEPPPLPAGTQLPSTN